MSARKDWEDLLFEFEGQSDLGREVIYPDSLGYPTVGPGILLTDTPYENSEIGSSVPTDWLDKKIRDRTSSAWDSAGEYIASSGMPDNKRAKEAIASMFYQLGPGWPSQHTETDRLLRSGDYAGASEEVWRDSEGGPSSWSTQTPKRVQFASDAFRGLSGRRRPRSAVGRSIEEEYGVIPGGSLQGEPEDRAAPEGYYTFNLPDFSSIDVPNEIPKERAAALAREQFPDSFPPDRDYETGGSSMFDAFLGAGSRSFSGLLPSVKAAYAVATGDEAGYDAAMADISAATERQMEIAPDLVDLEEIGDVYEEEGFFPAVGKFVEFSGEQMGNSFGFMGPEVLAGSAALAALKLASKHPIGRIAKTAATLGGAFLPGVANFMSQHLERDYSLGKVNTEDINLLKVVTAASGSTALNYLSYLMLGGIAGGAALSKGGRQAALAATTHAVRRMDRITPGKAFGLLIAEEEVAELAQTGLDRWQADLPLSPLHEEAMEEYIETALSVFGVSLGFGGLGYAGGKYGQSTKRKLETDKKAVSRARANALRALDESRKDSVGSDLEQNALSEADGEPAVDAPGPEVTPEDIHRAAEERNINSEDSGFHAFTRRVTSALDEHGNRKWETGIWRLDHPDATQSQLKTVLDLVSRMPVQAEKTRLNLADDAEVVDFSKKLRNVYLREKGKKGPMKLRPILRKHVRQHLKLNDKKLSDGLVRKLEDTYFRRLRELGLSESKVINGKKEQVLAENFTAISEPEYRAIVKDVNENGRFPNYRSVEVKNKFNIDSNSVWKKVREEAIRRGDIDASGKATRVAEAPVREGFRIRVGGQARPEFYETVEEAQAARDLLADGEEAVDIRDAVIEPSVDTTGEAGDVIERYRYRVEAVSGKDAPYVVRDSSGRVVNYYSNKKDAASFVRSQGMEKAFHVVENGRVKLTTRGDTARADAQDKIKKINRRIRKNAEREALNRLSQTTPNANTPKGRS